jgi:hypothetical protein
LRNIWFYLRECRGVASEKDVREIVQSLNRFGLVPGVGAWTGTATPQPVEDLTAHLEKVHHVAPPFRKPDPGVAAELWSFGMLCVEQPWVQAQAAVSRQQLSDVWDILLSVFTPSHARQGMTLEEFSASWCTLLEHLGDALYARAGPALALIVGHDSQYTRFAKDAMQRRLLIGWRTWYGPGYVEAFGRDWLLGLPDRARLLDDGGVAHALDADLAAVLRGEGDPYARVWPYLRAARITPAWPRPSRRPRKPTGQETKDAALTAFRRAVRELLETTIQLGERRVKMLPLGCNTLAREERLLALHSVREAVQEELAAHPSGGLHLEVSELPADLQALLDRLATGTGRLTYEVVPELAPPSEEGE